MVREDYCMPCEAILLVYGIWIRRNKCRFTGIFKDNQMRHDDVFTSSASVEHWHSRIFSVPASYALRRSFEEFVMSSFEV